jgi:hypothetical protein
MILGQVDADPLSAASYRTQGRGRRLALPASTAGAARRPDTAEVAAGGG